MSKLNACDWFGDVAHFILVYHKRMGTRKGDARKGQPKGARLAYDDTKKCTSCAGGGITSWRAAVSRANKKLGTNVAVPRKGTKLYVEAKKLYRK